MAAQPTKDVLEFYCNAPALRQASALFLATRFMPSTVTVEQVNDAVASTRRCLELEVFALCEAHGVDPLVWQILANVASQSFDEIIEALVRETATTEGSTAVH